MHVFTVPHTCTHTCKYIHTHAHTDTHTHTHTHSHTHTHTYTYTHTLTHTHTPQSQWRLHTVEELTEVDTMVKRLFKKASEQIVRNCEYYRVAIQREIDERARATSVQQHSYSPHPHSTFRYPSPTEAHEPRPHYNQQTSHNREFVERINSGGKVDFPVQNGTIKPRLSKNQIQNLEETFV